jgi:phage-related protein
MSAGPLKISILTDTKDVQQGMSKAEAAMDSAGNTAKKAGAKIDSAFDSTAEHADTVASKGAQAAGALSGLGGLVGGKFGAAMTAGGVAMQAFADAGDLANVVTESAIVRKAKDIAVTAGQTAATIASTVAQKAAAAASKAWTAAQWLLNAALDANPIGIVVLAIAALVAGIVVAYKKSDKFRAIVSAAFNAVQSAVSTAWGVIKGALNKFGDALTGVGDFATRMKNKITGGFSDVVDYIKSVPGKITALGGKFKDAGSSIMNKIIDGIKNAAGFIGHIAAGIWGAVKKLLNSAIDKINSALEFKIPIPGAPDISINPPDIPHLATGGITTGPTLALIGDNPSGRERVTPLDTDGLSAGERALLAALENLAALLRAILKGQGEQSIAFRTAVLAGANAHAQNLIKALAR